MKICGVENHSGDTQESLGLLHDYSNAVSNVLCFSFNVWWHLTGRHKDVALYSETTWTHMSEETGVPCSYWL